MKRLGKSPCLAAKKYLKSLDTETNLCWTERSKLMAIVGFIVTWSRGMLGVKNIWELYCDS